MVKSKTEFAFGGWVGLIKIGLGWYVSNGLFECDGSMS